MNEKYVVSRMTKDEIPVAIEWAAKEGWNPGLHDADCFYQADPHGFFAGKIDGKIIAIGSAVIYDNQFAFCGFYMVDNAHRGQGYGLSLTQQRLAYIGQRNAGIDGVTVMLEKYARLGYKLAHKNGRYFGKDLYLTEHTNSAITALANIDFDALIHFDRRHFPAPRSAFLQCWINQPGSKSWGYILDGQLCGYGVIRECRQGFKIGPLFADSPRIADALFLKLVHHADGQLVYLDIPENNPQARELVNRYSLQKSFETARMYLKSEPNIMMEHIYGITSFELG